MMERELTFNEKNRINEICKSNMTLAILFGNIAKIMAPLFTIALFLFLYFEISWGSIWIYIGIAIFLSIIELRGIADMQAPYVSINTKDCSCIEAEMLSNRRALIVSSQNLIPRHVLEKMVLPGETRHYSYYVTVNIAGEVKEIKYIGKEFDYLKIGEKILVIKYKNRKKDIEYVCLSNKEVNA